MGRTSRPYNTTTKQQNSTNQSKTIYHTNDETTTNTNIPRNEKQFNNNSESSPQPGTSKEYEKEYNIPPTSNKRKHISNPFKQHKQPQNKRRNNSIIEYIPTKLIYYMGQIGLQADSFIKRLLQNKQTLQKQLLKQTHYYDLLPETTETNDTIINWLEKLFISNDININEFFAKFILIQSRQLNKINTFIIKGPTNTGKSLLINALLKPLEPTLISRERDRSGFHLDQLPTAGYVLFEEPIIDNTNIGTWKLLMEGSELTTDIKNQSKEIIERLPFL